MGAPAFVLLLQLLILALPPDAAALNNGLGRTPQMGYNTWNDFRCDGITSAHMRQVVDKMAELGLGDLGYEYVNIDDCWIDHERDGHGRLVANPSAFPEGMRALSDYVHSKGFKLGIYADRGNMTCARFPGSRGFETIDAATFADWGVDYLKEDSCHSSQVHADAFFEYGLMRDALNATGRPIFFSLCGGNPWYSVPDPSINFKGGSSLGNSWRVAPDCINWKTVFVAIQINARLAAYSAPGGWNDPDMLIGSSPGTASVLLPSQSRTQFALWSVMAAPLLIGSKLLNLTAFDLQTYTNQHVIRIDQDPLGVQGRPVVDTCPEQHEPLAVLWERGQKLLGLALAGVDEGFDVPDCRQIWAKPLQDGAVAVVMVNYGAEATRMQVDFATDLGLEEGKAHVKDLWLGRSFPPSSAYDDLVPGDGGSVTLLVTPLSKPTRGPRTWADDVVVSDSVL